MKDYLQQLQPESSSRRPDKGLRSSTTRSLFNYRVGKREKIVKARPLGWLAT
jgi:hypothetical protein